MPVWKEKSHAARALPYCQSAPTRTSVSAMALNRFDLLRLVFAGMVFVYHLVVLASLDPNGTLEAGLAAAAELSIQGFFVLSGALVFGSWQRSTSLWGYAEKRIRRLYPAYAVIILLPAFCSMVLSSDLGGSLRYVGANLVFANFLAPSLPGLFEGQRFEAVNGALWTLKIEVMFYMLLVIIGPVLAWCLARSQKWALMAVLVIYAGGEIWRMAFAYLATSDGLPIYAIIARQLPGQLAFFTAGIALWIWQDQIRAHLGTVGLFSALSLIVSFLVPFAEMVRPMGLAGLVAWLAWSAGPKPQAARFGDISYGLYICHFPIIQTLVATGAYEASLPMGVSLTLVLVTVASFALWHFVERPALRSDSHYRAGS